MFVVFVLNLLEKCHRVLPEMVIESGPLPRRLKSWLLPQGSRSVLYIPIPTAYFPALNRFVPDSALNHAVIPGHSILMPKTQAMDPTYWTPNVTECRKSQLPEMVIEPGPQDLKATSIACYIYLSPTTIRVSNSLG